MYKWLALLGENGFPLPMLLIVPDKQHMPLMPFLLFQEHNSHNLQQDKSIYLPTDAA